MIKINKLQSTKSYRKSCSHPRFQGKKDSDDGTNTHLKSLSPWLVVKAKPKTNDTVESRRRRREEEDHQPEKRIETIHPNSSSE